MRYFIVVAMMLSLVGCKKPFQPIAPAYKFWSKEGASELQIKKAMLECGDPSPDPTISTYEQAFGLIDDDEQLNKMFLSAACMENAGYKPKLYTVREYCSWDRHKHLPVCQPGAEIPKPSLERRLNSWWCKLKTDRAYCHKHAYVSSACDNPKKDYNNPPPECRP